MERMESNVDGEERDAILVVIEQPNAAGTALKTRQSAELTHVMSRFADEPRHAFARRVLHRVRRLRQKGMRIRELTVAVAEGPSGSRTQGRLLTSLVRALSPGATFTLVASCVNQVDVLGWMQTLMPLAQAGVSLDIVA